MSNRLNIIDILPKNWIDPEGKVSVFCSTYHCLTKVLEREKRDYISGQIFNTAYLIVRTSFEYQTSRLKYLGVLENGTLNFVQELTNHNESSNGAYIIFYSRYKGAETEDQSISEIRISRGLLNLVEGRNTIFLHIYDNILHLPSGESEMVSDSIKMPEIVQSFENGITIDEVTKQILILEESIQNRIKLAMKWVDDAEHENQPIDSFLKLWFALEVLSMPNTTNIKPLNTTLGKIYTMSSQDVGQTFKIGIIFSLRSHIVHNGLNIPIHMQLNLYLKALITDVLHDLCSMPSKLLAQQVLLNVDYVTGEEDWIPTLI